MNLSEKTILITGASRGLGKALAIALREENATIIAGLRQKEEINEYIEADIDTIELDVTDEESVRNAFDSIVSMYGKLDMVINNAGVWIPHPLVPVSDVSIEDTVKMIDVNLYGLMRVSKKALEVMRGQKSGTIVNIISTSGLEGRNGSAGYSASKFAADGFSKSMRIELENNDEPISIINVYPGGIKTDLFRSKQPTDIETFMDPTYVAESITENIKKETPEKDQIIRRPSTQ